MKKRILVALSAVLVAVMLVATVSAASFDDVKEGDWYYDAVQYVSDNGLMKGTGTGFAPTKLLSRAELAVMLYNLEVAVYGTPDEVTEASPFTDCDAVASWAGTAIDWAYANGIITGSSATTFSPTVTLNRASMAVMFTRYIKMHGLEDTIDITRVDDKVVCVEIFADEFDWVNSDWYEKEVHYVGSVGLIGGKPTDNPDMFNFDPEGTASRAEAATVLTRLHKFISIPTIGAERAFALFNANYLCAVHSDVLMHYNKQGTMNGSTQAAKVPEILHYADIIEAFDEKLEYDRDEYFFRIANKNEVLAGLSGAPGAGFGLDVVMELVRWDGTAAIQNTVELRMEQRKWTNENVIHRQISIPLGNWACNDTEENYAEAIQADLDAKFKEFLDYAVVDGKIYLKYEVKDYGWAEWVREPLNLAFFNSGIGRGEYHVELMELMDEEEYLSAERNEGEAGKYWTEELQAKKDALHAAFAAGQQVEFTGTLRLTLSAGFRNDENDFTGMPEATETVTIVYVPVTDRTALMNGGYSNVVIPTELKADEITEFALCEECGKLHYICSRKTINEQKLLDDFVNMNQVLFNKNKYIVTGLKLDDTFKTDLANLSNLEIASGKATFTFTDAYSMSKTLDVEIDLTVQMNTNIKKSPDGRAWNTYAETINVCPDSNDYFRYGFSATEELEKFVEENTCAECGVIHMNFNNAGEATVANVENAILNKIGARIQQRTVKVTTDTKTYLNNNFTDATLAAKTADGKIYTKKVAIIYGSSAFNDVAVAEVVLDIRVNSTYWTSIVPTQNLVNEITGEEFVTCPYNLENITKFEKSVIAAKVDKIVAEVGFDGTIYAWYGKGINGEGNFGYRHGGFGWAQWVADRIVLRHADFTDCARKYLDNEDQYGTFTEASYNASFPENMRNNEAVADGQILVDNKTFVLEFKTKTTGEIFQKEVNITIGRNDGSSLHPYGSYAFFKDITTVMAEEKAAIQAVFDSFIAANAVDGVVNLRIDGDAMWWTWMEGVTGRLILDNLINSYTDGALAPLVSAYVPDGYFVMGVMSQDDWAFLGKNMGEIPDGKQFETREFTISIRGAKSGISQDYKIKLNILQDSSFDNPVEVRK